MRNPAVIFGDSVRISVEVEDGTKAKNIVIYQRDNDVIAFDVLTGKKGKASCNTQDNFDFYFGARLALQRLAESAFIPHLSSLCCEDIGVIGQPTDIKDIFGNSLRVGDTVNLLTTRNGQFYSSEERSVVEDDSGPFVMGSKCADFRNGISKSGFLASPFAIILKRRHEDIKDGESVDVIKYIKTERRGKQLWQKRSKK